MMPGSGSRPAPATNLDPDADLDPLPGRPSWRTGAHNLRTPTCLTDMAERVYALTFLGTRVALQSPTMQGPRVRFSGDTVRPRRVGIRLRALQSL